MTGIERIAAERQRQLDEEHWTDEHDDFHTNESMAKAAAAYAIHGTIKPTLRDRDGRFDGREIFPWGLEWWKPGHQRPKEVTIEDRIRNLEKAGALCAAEIDRLTRKET